MVAEQGLNMILRGWGVLGLALLGLLLVGASVEGSAPRPDVLELGPVDLRGGKVLQIPGSNFENGDVNWSTNDMNIQYHSSGGPNGRGYVSFTRTQESFNMAMSPRIRIQPNRVYVVSMVVRKRFFGGEFNVGLRQTDLQGNSVYFDLNGIPDDLDDEWVRFEVMVHTHPKAELGQFYFRSFTGGTLDVADIQLIELPPSPLEPFEVGQGVTFAGSLGGLPMEMKSPNTDCDGQRIELEATGSSVIFDLVSNELTFTQKIGMERVVAKAETSVPLKGLRVLEADAEKVVLTNNQLTVSMHADGLLLFAPHEELSFELTGLFVGDWNQFDAGHLLSIDEFGGISVNPHIPLGTGRLARAELLEGDRAFPHPSMNLQTGRLTPRDPTDSWRVRWQVSPGERLGVSVFPPRPYDWERALNDEFLWTHGFDPAWRTPREAEPVVDQYMNDFDVNVFGVWNSVFSFREGGGYGGSSGPHRIRSERVHENLVGFMKMLHDKGARGILYMSPWFYYTDDHYAYFEDLKKWAEEYRLDGVYWDGSYPLDWLKTYELLRMTRELFPYGQGYIYHHTSGQPYNGGYPLAQPNIFIPVLDTYADRILRGESVQIQGEDSPYPRLVTAAYGVSNTVGVIKAHYWDVPFETYTLRMLSYGGRIQDRPILTHAPQDESEFIKTVYYPFFRALRNLWNDHRDDQNFFENHYLPLLRESVPALPTPITYRGPRIQVEGWPGRVDIEHRDRDVFLHLMDGKKALIPSMIYVNIPDASSVELLPQGEPLVADRLGSGLAIHLGTSANVLEQVTLRLQNAQSPTAIDTIRLGSIDPNVPVQRSIPLELDVATIPSGIPIERTTVLVDGEVVAVGDGVAEDVVLETIGLTDGEHEMRIRVQGLHGTPHADLIVQFLVENTRILSPLPRQTITGTLALEMETELRPEEVERVTIRLDENEIYSEEDFPQVLNVDTRTLEDGLHRLQIEIRKMGHDRPDVKRVDFLTRNLDVLRDSFEPPLEAGWFGDPVDRSKTSDRYGDWQYAFNDASTFFGDEHRIVPSGNPNDYLEWEMPGLRDITFVFYVTDPSIVDRAFAVYASVDHTEWELVSTTTEVLSHVETDWLQVVLQGDVNTVDGDYRWVRLVVEDHVSGVQIGEAEFTGIRFQ